MHLSSLCLSATAALLAFSSTLSGHAEAATTTSGKGKPGYCADSTKCAATYSCVSVQTTRSGITDVKQCLPTAASSPICTGVAPGLCPSFSTTWGTAFREISSVCAYISPESSGGKCITAGSTTNTTTKGGLECLFVQDPANKTAQLGVIYGCVDFDGSRLLFEKNSASDKVAAKFNYSEVIADSCVNPKNPSGSSFVCSSQGTCAPKSAGSMDYACACNVGFSGTYCEKIVNNKCYNDGVCGGGSCDLTTNECTNCTAGTLGDKCAQCDPTYDSTKVCSAHGKCVASSGTSTLGAADTDGSSASSGTARFLAATVEAATASATYQCECDTGYSDVHCGVAVKTNSSSSQTTTTAPSTDGSAASAVVTASSIVGLAVVAMAFSV